MIGKLLFYAIDIFFLLLSFILLIVGSGVGYMYFNNDIFVIPAKYNYKVFFLCSLCFGIITFFGVWIFLFCPKIIWNYVVTFPIFFILLIIFVYFSYPANLSKYFDGWDNKWNDTFEIRSLQIKQKCCGWVNFSDRGLNPCPPTFFSGCKPLLEAYLKPRLQEVFIFGLLSIFLGLITSIPLFIYCSRTKDSSIISQFDIF